MFLRLQNVRTKPKFCAKMLENGKAIILDVPNTENDDQRFCCYATPLFCGTFHNICVHN